MKGLIIKDFKLLKNQKNFILIISVVCIFLFVKGNDPAYVFSYIAAMFSVLVVGTIGYDEENNGMGFLFTFPVSRKIYVLEKYVFGMLIVAAVLAAGMAVAAAVTAVKAAVYGSIEWVPVLLGAILTSALIQSVTIPVQLKFGSSKSRVALLVVIMCVAIAGYGAEQIAVAVHMDLSGILEVSRNVSTGAAAAGIFVLSAWMLGISYAVSVRVMKKKQF